MVIAAAPPTMVEHDNPRWLSILVAWRAVVLGLVVLALAGTLARVGIVLSGPIRWTLAVALLAASGGAAWALIQTRRRRHSGRVAGFATDYLLTVVLGFVGANRMGLFVGLDTVGAAFNENIGWIGIIVLGWLASGAADRLPAAAQSGLKQAGRYTMLLGLAILLLTMGIVPGLVELGKRMLEPSVLPVLVLAVTAAVFARLLWSDRAARVFGTSQSQAEAMDGMLFVAPNALGFLAFFAGPLIVSLFISLTEWDGLTDAKFVGLANYVELLSDELFLRSIRNIIVFGLIAIPAAVLPALVLAALLNSKLPGMKFFRAIYFLPSIAGVVGVTLIWKQLYNSTVGYINYAILRTTELLNGWFGTAFEAPQPQWISDADIALFSVIILFAWQTIGFNTVLFLAGMQGIDGSLYEAADIDGASAWTRFRRITVPLLRPTTVFVVATTTILALQLFNEPFILQAPSRPAGPGNSTLTPVVYLYENAFAEFQIGYASAVAWALFILIFGVTLAYFRRQGDDGVLSS